MRIVTAEEFLEMPRGTVFAYGEPFAFGPLLVKYETIRGEGYWGFWALNPCWISENGDEDQFLGLDDMLRNGTSAPMDDSVSKYMSYDGDKMDCFLIFEPDDVERLKSIMGNAGWE